MRRTETWDGTESLGLGMARVEDLLRIVILQKEEDAGPGVRGGESTVVGGKEGEEMVRNERKGRM